MEKWKLNVELLKDIFDVCGRPVKRTLEGLEIKYSTWMTWMSVETGKDGERTSEQGGITVVALLAVCNGLCIPVRKLFYKEGEAAVIPLRQELECQKSRFISSRFDRETFQAAFGIRSKAGKSIEKMLKELQYSFKSYSNWLAEDSSLRVAQLLRFCELYEYDLFSFLVDGNVIAVKKPKEEPSVMTDEEEKEKMQKDIASLRERNSKLSRQIKEKSREVEKLTSEVFNLKVRNNELESEVARFKQHIGSIEFGSHGMVAENDFPEWERGGSKEEMM